MSKGKVKVMNDGIALFSPPVKFGEGEYAVLIVEVVEEKTSFLDAMVSGAKDTAFVAFKTPKGAPVHNIEGNDIAAAMESLGYEMQ